MLEIGYNSNFEIRMDEVTYHGKQRIRLAYLSDLHFNKFSEAIVFKIISEIEKLDPDMVLLGGDYVDTKKGLVHLDQLLDAFSKRKHVFAVAGNHDHFFGIEQVQKMMQRHKITWIEKKSVQISIGDCLMQIDGTIPALPQGKADLKILCLHQPLDLAKLPVVYDLAFAGHLHGSQFVFWQTKKGLYPGRLFYKWNILKTTLKNCHYYISKGLGDTLPIRFNCLKDLLVVDLIPSANV
jgi:predicted MPP superfamily phosphohydrolase